MFRFRSPLLLDLFLTEYMPQRIPGCADSTRRGYEITLRLYSRWLGKPARLRHLTSSLVARFQEDRLRVDKVAKATVCRDVSCLKALATWAFNESRLHRPLSLLRLPSVVPTPRALSETEVSMVWQVLGRAQPVVISCSPKKTVEPRTFWEPLILVLHDTGERFGAVFDLTMADLSIDGPDPWVNFPAESRKGGRKSSRMPIHEDTSAAIKKLLATYKKKTYSSRLFRWALCKSSIWARLGDIMQMSGVDGGRRRELSFHVFRKTTATAIAMNSDLYEAQDALGHSSSETTKKHYIDPRLFDRDRQRERLNRLFRPGRSA